MDILRFITAGSVDDGKSTLIGRLLYDSKSILVDQMAAIEKHSKNKENGEIDLAILTDGLRAEREQGITIDVAYKYFNTTKRKFIIADAPGHVQYTRNMVTGASNSDLVVVLIDARKGVIEQTKRHSLIATLLGIPHVVVAINKMDLVNFSEEVFNNIVAQYQVIQAQLNLSNVIFIPISALSGENIVTRSEKMTWYKGESLLELLESVEIQNEVNTSHARFSVQYVIRPQSEKYHDYRGYAGKINSGVFHQGDKVFVQPSGISTKIKAIEHNFAETEFASIGESVILHLEDNIDVSRGDMIVGVDNPPQISQDINAFFCWMDTKGMILGGKYILQHNSRTVRCVIKEVEYKLNVNTLEKDFDTSSVNLNDVGKFLLKTASPLVFDNYTELRQNGGAILIDETSNLTVAAVIIQ